MLLHWRAVRWPVSLNQPPTPRWRVGITCRYIENVYLGQSEYTKRWLQGDRKVAGAGGGLHGPLTTPSAAVPPADAAAADTSIWRLQCFR